MGTWSAEPFGNDAAADWAWELDDSEDWGIVADALRLVLDEDDPAELDADTATVAIAAAEVLAHSLGRPTQSDSYTESVAAFINRAPAPPAGLAAEALKALDVATTPAGELAELWLDEGSEEWSAANDRLREALSQPRRTSPDAPKRRMFRDWLKRGS